MTEFPFVTWACKYPLALVSGWVADNGRVIYHATHFCPRWSCIATRQASSCSLLDMRHPIGVASRRSSLSHSQSLVASSTIRYTTLFIFQGRLKHVLPHHGFLPPSKVTDAPSNPDSPRKGALTCEISTCTILRLGQARYHPDLGGLSLGSVPTSDAWRRRKAGRLTTRVSMTTAFFTCTRVMIYKPGRAPNRP